MVWSCKSLFIVLFLASVAFADEGPLRIRLDGGANRLDVAPGTSKLTLYGSSPGNVTSPLELEGSFPEGTRVRVQAAKVRGSIGATLARRKGYFSIQLRERRELAENAKGVCLPLSLGEGEETAENEEFLSPTDFPEMSSPICDLYSPEDKDAIRQQLAATFGGVWSAGQVCGFLVAVSNDPDLGGKEQWCALYDWHLLLGLGINCFPDTLFATLPAAASVSLGQGVELWGLLRKDACEPRNVKYLVKVELRFAEISPEIRDQGFTILFRAREVRHQGGRQASIKPRSEGRYAPRPLVLMNWLSDLCGNSLTLTKWSGGKPRSVRELSIYSFLVYRNLVLALATADRVLTGGRGTFELSNGFEAYGVCMRLERVRQRVNGYPG